MKRLFLLYTLLLFVSCPAFCCTSVIISGKVTSDGKPLMFKHRDTGEMNNRVEYFNGLKYSFIGLVNSSSKGGEVWTGLNDVGFAIMNTASYNIKNDDVPASQMDKEGILMYRALGVCCTIKDFEFMLDTLSRPICVEANFGVIDANGGAAYYEVNNSSWVKYDVNEESSGYRVVTNFSFSGRERDREGYERYLTASDIMKELRSSKKWNTLSHSDLFNYLSRSYRHSLTGMDYGTDYSLLERRTGFTGIAIDQDFIPRKITSASVVISGVAVGESASHSIMWTILGYPACSVAIPLLVSNADCLPSYVKCIEDSDNSELCDIAINIKEDFVFNMSVSNGSKYFRIDNIIKGTEGRAALLDCSYNAENKINSQFYSIYYKWVYGSMSDNEFYDLYQSSSADYFKYYLDAYKDYL